MKFKLCTTVIVLSFLYSILSHAETLPNSDQLQYFKTTYAEADQNFDEIFNPIRQQNSEAEVFQFIYPHGKIKSYFIPAQQKSKEIKPNLLVIIAGTHGIEAHAGSAVQRYLLHQKKIHSHTSILMIHGFNLWGFQNGRRVNEANIDLNRAFILDRNKFQPDDSAYAKLNDFLNPTNPPHPHFLGHGYFIAQAVYNIIKYSIESLRASILKGQYSFEKGLFYGGKNPVDQELMIQQLVDRYAKGYHKIFIIDLHTGYGEKSKLHLLSGQSQDTNSQILKNIFPIEEIDFADKKKFYAIQGEMLVYFSLQFKDRLPTAEVSGITFEYGTLDSQKTMGSIESLRRMRMENQNQHYTDANSRSPKVAQLFTEMFYPTDPNWRLEILKQTDIRIEQVNQYLTRP